jgi:hypothetical protein
MEIEGIGQGKAEKYVPALISLVSSVHDKPDN